MQGVTIILVVDLAAFATFFYYSSLLTVALHNLKLYIGNPGSPTQLATVRGSVYKGLSCHGNTLK